MPRNLDMTALRAFVTVAEAGGVTKAAALLHLTQSAVSMQIKRLEEGLGMPLFHREARGLHLTGHGDHLLGYGKKMLALNDEILGRLSDTCVEGELTIGVPHDIVYPHIPYVLQRLAIDYPKVKVHLISSFTEALKERFARGEADLILTTEEQVGPKAEVLAELPLVWVGAPGGQAWRNEPIRLAFVRGCLFSKTIKERLTDAGIAWENAVDSDFNQTVDATISADLAIHAALEGTLDHRFEVIRPVHLPLLPRYKIAMYVNQGAMSGLATDVGAIIRERYALARAA